jgi:hypothetical protein
MHSSQSQRTNITHLYGAAYPDWFLSRGYGYGYPLV